MRSARTRARLIRPQSPQVFEEGNLERADELVDPDYVNHNRLPGQPAGVEGVKAGVRMFHAAFPDSAGYDATDRGITLNQGIAAAHAVIASDDRESAQAIKPRGATLTARTELRDRNRPFENHRR